MPRWPNRTITERFEAMYDPEPNTGCWLWFGARDHAGYGRFYDGERARPAHRISILLSGRELTPGMFVDHLCRVPACVNPDHLELVTPRENSLRGFSICARRAVATHCDRGHAFAGENLVMEKGHRRCRTCRIAGMRRYIDRIGKDRANEMSRAAYARRKGLADADA